MNISDENKNTMAIAVREYLEDAPAGALAASPGLDENIVELVKVLDDIRDLNEFQTINRSGYRILKGQSKEVMCVTGANIVDALRGYANFSNNEVLFAEMDLTYWDLIKKRDTEARNTCLFIHTRGEEHAAGIETYGVTADVLNKFTDYITDFEENMAKPRLTIADRRILTQGLVVAFEKLDVILEDLDAKVYALRLLFSDFVDTYKVVRKIVNYKGSALSISGKVFDESGQPIYGATVWIKELERSAKSTYKGNFQFKHVADGTYTVVVNRPGYISQEVLVGVVKGETSKLWFVLKVMSLGAA